MILTSTITIHRGSRNRYGDRAGETTHDIDGCVVVPTTSTEQYGDRADQVSTTLTVIAQQGVDVVAADTVTVPGYTGQFQVVGDPLRYPTPPGWQFGTEVRLTKITG